MKLRFFLFTVMLAFISLLSVSAHSVFAFAISDKAPKGYYIYEDTLSPDHKYGVTVFDNTENDAPDDGKSQIIEVKTGKLLGAINAELACKNMNHDTIVPTRWTADDSTLLWLVDGKWGFSNEVLIHLKDEKIASQIDVLDLLQKEILKRTKAATPKEYAKVQATSGDFGSWYKDGFAIDCVPDDRGNVTDKPLVFPLLYHVFLTSNTKGLEDVVNVDSRMTALLHQDGTIEVIDFHMGKEPPSRTWE
jgi:hypothetical protein